MGDRSNVILAFDEDKVYDYLTIANFRSHWGGVHQQIEVLKIIRDSFNEVTEEFLAPFSLLHSVSEIYNKPPTLTDLHEDILEVALDGFFSDNEVLAVDFINKKIFVVKDVSWEDTRGKENILTEQPLTIDGINKVLKFLNPYKDENYHINEGESYY